jgi:hypothetical protein
LYLLTYVYIDILTYLDILTIQRFFIEYRKGLGHHAAASTNPKLPKINSLEDWQKNPSTKYQVCIDTVKHLLSRDDAPKPESDSDGKVIFPPLPPVSEGEFTPGSTRKGIIYAEFTSMVPFLQDVS